VDSDEQTRDLGGAVVHTAAAVVKGHPLQARIRRVAGVGNELLWESVEAFADGINIWRAGGQWQQNVIRTLAIFLHRDASKGQPDLDLPRHCCHDYISDLMSRSNW
jgi:hypothetical protein